MMENCVIVAVQFPQLVFGDVLVTIRCFPPISLGVREFQKTMANKEPITRTLRHVNTHTATVVSGIKLRRLHPKNRSALVLIDVGEGLTLGGWSSYAAVAQLKGVARG
jgi:hypothetical protein